MNPLSLLFLLALLGGVVLVLRRRGLARGPSRERLAGWRRDFALQVERHTRLLAVVALVLIAALLGLAALYNLLTARAPERFVVVVAPFADGGSGETGRNVATELARLLRDAGHGNITTLVAPSSPETPQAALELAASESADVLLWGEVEPGALLDSASLHPRLIYTPNGPYAPDAWAGYQSRFTMPRSYTLARAPLNGQAVLVPLVQALYAYGNDQPDIATEQLEQLLKNYPALSPTLPRALHGNLLWAAGFTSEAASEYRLALAEPGDEQARLANNLGAILMDAGDSNTLTAFAEAVRLLDGHDLGELRVNLGLIALREQRPLDATVEFEQARNLIAPNTPLLISLTTAYRETGRLTEAAATLEAADAQSKLDLALVPSGLRPMLSKRTEAAFAEQHALLDLATSLNAQGPVVWELEAARPLPADTIRPIRDALNNAATSSQAEVSQWRRHAASEGAARPSGGTVSTGQADQAERQVERQRYYQALVGADLERPGAKARDIFGALFGIGNRANLTLSTLEPLIVAEPTNPALYLARGRAQIRLGQLDEADASYDQAISLAPQQPEGYFGKGMVAQQRNGNDTARASELFNQALGYNAAFFPARVQLSRMAEARGDWPAAVAQRRALLTLRPSAQNKVALAQALRKSGQANWTEAEQILIPLSTDTAAAAIELGRLYNDSGHPDAALSAYNDALRIEPRSSTAAFERGETLARQGNYAEAERSLRAALGFDKTNIDAQLALADLYYGPLNDPGKADQAYREALAQGVHDAERLEKIGDAASNTGNSELAARAYTDAYELKPNDPMLNYKLGMVYYAQKRMEMAIERQEKVLALTENPADAPLAALRASALIARADIDRIQGNGDAATKRYTQALQIDGNRVAAHLGLGMLAVGQGNWGVAHSYFERAASLPEGVNSPDAQFWLGESLLRRSDLLGALKHYNAALALKADFPEVYLGLAQTRYAQGDRAAALDTVNTGLRLRPNYAEALLFQGKLLQESDRPAEALTAYNRSISANDQIPESLYARALLQIQNGNYDQAIKDLGRATNLKDKFADPAYSAYSAYWLGRAYYAQGRLDRALDAFREAIKANGSYADAIFYSGMVAEDLGHTAEAISAYQTVIQLDSHSDLAARAQAKLDRLT